MQLGLNVTLPLPDGPGRPLKLMIAPARERISIIPMAFDRAARIAQLRAVAELAA
jgi:hypothetical protein